MTYVGRDVPSLTNAKLAAGKGTFVDDVSFAGDGVCRSPPEPLRARAHPLDRHVGGGAAPRRRLRDHGARGRAEHEPDPRETAAVGAKGVKWHPLCVERARYVGEAVAAVVAEDRFTAYEALDLIDVDYEELPVVADPEEAMKPGAPLVEPEWGDNILASRDIVLGDPDAAFAEADATVSGFVRSSRITGTAIEPRGCVADYDPYGDSLTFWDSTQNPHPLRNYIAESSASPIPPSA